MDLKTKTAQKRKSDGEAYLERCAKHHAGDQSPTPTASTMNSYPTSPQDKLPLKVNRLPAKLLLTLKAAKRSYARLKIVQNASIVAATTILDEPATEEPEYNDPSSQSIPVDEPRFAPLSNMYPDSCQAKLELIKECLADQRFDRDIIVLPNLFFNTAIQAIFNPYYVNTQPEKQFIMMVNRKSIVDEIKNQLYKNKIAIVSGPQGTGKSFVVYQAVAALMQEEDNFVVYVNDAQDALPGHLVNTIAAMLTKEEVSEIIESISEEATTLKKIGANLRLALDFIHTTWDLIQEKNPTARLIFVIDQVSSIKDRKEMDFMRNLEAYHCIFVISANNTPTYFEQKHLQPFVNEEHIRFTQDQFRAMCVILEKTSKPDVRQFSQAQMHQIMSITGGIPLFLREFLETPYTEGFEQAMSKYRNNVLRVQLDYSRIQSFWDLQDEDKKELALDNIRLLLAGEPVYSNNSIYDRRFIYLSKADFKLKAVSTLAYNAVLDFYLKLLQ